MRRRKPSLPSSNSYFRCTIATSLNHQFNRLHTSHGFCLKSALHDRTFTTNERNTSTPHSKRKNWRDIRTQREYFDWLSKELNIQSHEDWYKIKTIEVKKRQGSVLLSRYYDNSLIKALSSVYPDVEWHPWKFQHFTSHSQKWEDERYHRKFLEWLYNRLKMKSMDEWYSMTLQELKKHGGQGLLELYDNSLHKMLSKNFPEHEWNECLFVHLPQGFWDDEDNQRRYLEWLGNRLGVKKLEDWYEIKYSQVVEANGCRLLNSHYGGSLSKALMHLYPGVDWNPWKFATVPSGYWDNFINRRRYFDWLSVTLQVVHYDEWYEVKLPQVIEHHGASIMSSKFGNSMFKALSEVYPEFVWFPWLFNSVPDGFWNDLEHQKQFFEWAKDVLQIRDFNEWLAVRASDIASIGGAGLIYHVYDGSMHKALQAVYPQMEWFPWLFATVPVGWWSSSENQKNYMKFLENRLNIRHVEDWYNVKLSQVIELGGSGLLAHYENSLVKCITSIYNEFPWKPWLFNVTPTSFWENQQNHRIYFDWLEEKLEIQSPNDWYRVTVHDVIAIKGGSTLLQKYGGLINMLTAMYPQHAWEHSGNSHKGEIHLRSVLKKHFPNVEIIFGYKHNSLLYSRSKSPMELDIFIPSLSLAFEYNGVQHYHWNALFGSPEELEQKDEEKREMCRVRGITLIEVPFWWDKTEETLLATIHQFRPDVVELPPDATPIPASMPVKPNKRSNQAETEVN